MQVFAFIDTNVLLHYRFFRDVNWATELHAEEATLVFAPVVVEELDKRKWAGARRDRERAKSVLKALKDLGLSAAPVAMRPGVEIVVLDEEPADALFARHRLQPGVSDDRLLASVLAFKEAQRGSAAILVLTADTGLSIKAPTRQIAVVAPDERLQRDDEPDETERKLEAAQRDLAALRAVAPSLRLTVAGETVQFVDRADVGLVASAGIGKRFSHIVEARLERTVHGAVAGTFAGQDVDHVAQVGPRVADAVGILTDEFGIAQPAPVEVVAESRDGCIEANDRPVDSTAEALAATRTKTNGEQRDSKQGGGSGHGSVHQSSLQSAEPGRSTPRTATVDPGTARAMASAARSASQSPHMNTSKAA